MTSLPNSSRRSLITCLLIQPLLAARHPVLLPKRTISHYLFVDSATARCDARLDARAVALSHYLFVDSATARTPSSQPLPLRAGALITCLLIQPLLVGAEVLAQEWNYTLITCLLIQPLLAQPGQLDIRQTSSSHYLFVDSVTARREQSGHAGLLPYSHYLFVDSATASIRQGAPHGLLLSLITCLLIQPLLGAGGSVIRTMNSHSHYLFVDSATASI